MAHDISHWAMGPWVSLWKQGKELKRRQKLWLTWVPMMHEPGDQWWRHLFWEYKIKQNMNGILLCPYSFVFYLSVISHSRKTNSEMTNRYILEIFNPIMLCLSILIWTLSVFYLYIVISNSVFMGFLCACLSLHVNVLH